ncbi:MAG TPA: zinc-dependent alcohol dehydrogenase family protein [Smithellaceae bacterium]|jgi:propanol-preferring alcohol dehydrogenase|nr:zinc-dependent alcohol dehydrogenase family protein [Syntrophaceae bacterium]HNY95919.1 zinc-dependent alcohol dehydrogenase family protein [Smithellaceae bacterium]MBP8665876.1 zinc-dependent alcohol dehydrogenase family protein [Syntrophaceae bacterium]MBP9531049.1 zinc-dependent alcohol dehydrogenase family protein [Syntrophaceae bacterium]MBP9650763.1 zinc-dependent alcohol dehydrogenase family protein [Syntrophaceae bacterium]
MKAAVLESITNIREHPRPLSFVDLPDPEPFEGQILVRVSTCGVCHTELDEIEGRTPPSSFPFILGHQIVGIVEKCGPRALKFSAGQRVGIGWIGSACGTCNYCRGGMENLCPDFRATGRDIPGGYAQYTTVLEDFAFPVPDAFSDAQAAPLLCAGAIGWRSLRLAGLADGEPLGLTGFGASAHLVLQLARYLYPRSKICVFARSERERNFALSLGAGWAGEPAEKSPEKLAAVIDTTPAWKPVVEALANLAPGGRLVINAIRKEASDRDQLLRLEYPLHLWQEKEIKSVANVARRDIAEFLDLAAKIPILPDVEEYAFFDANRALAELKAGQIRGAKVLKIGNGL